MNYYIGIDGGGTTTTAVLTDEAGRELARVRGAAGLVNVLEPEAGAQKLADLASQALAEAKAETRAAVLVCALAGAGREPERTRLEQSLAAQGVAEWVHVISDFEAALQDAFADGSGILIIAGTGSSSWARNEDGRSARAGGWGQVLGDEGSGFSIGLAALQHCMRAHDGRDVGDAHWPEMILAHTQVATVEGLVRWTAGASKADVAALAPLVFEAAEQGTVAAIRIVEHAAHELALHARALHERLMPWRREPMVALSGGLIAPGRPLRDATVRHLREIGLELPIFERRIDAALGAVAIARTREQLSGR